MKKKYAFPHYFMRKLDLTTCESIRPAKSDSYIILHDHFSILTWSCIIIREILLWTWICGFLAEPDKSIFLGFVSSESEFISNRFYNARHSRKDVCSNLRIITHSSPLFFRQKTLVTQLFIFNIHEYVLWLQILPI